MRQQTKTFLEHRYFHREADGGFIPVPPAAGSLGIDEQVNAWAAETGATITHPGSLAIETTWYKDNDENVIRCVTLGLVVLYQGGANDGTVESGG